MSQLQFSTGDLLFSETDYPFIEHLSIIEGRLDKKSLTEKSKKNEFKFSSKRKFNEKNKFSNR